MLDKLKLFHLFTQYKLVLTPSRNWKGREFAEWFWNSHNDILGFDGMCENGNFCTHYLSTIFAWSLQVLNQVRTPTFFFSLSNTLHHPCINVEIKKGKQICVDQKEKFNNRTIQNIL